MKTQTYSTNLLMAIIVISLLLLPSVSATEISMGVYKKGSCVELIQLCGDCTYNNITSIIYPNVTKIIIDKAMTKRGSEYNYTYCFPDLNGEYLINGVGDLSATPTVWAYTISLTPNGDIVTTAKVILFFGSICILSIFLIFSIIGIFKVEDYKGRFVLYWVSHLLLIAISFMIYNGADTLLTTAPFVKGFFRIIFWVSMTGAFPMMILSLAWIFYIHTVNDDVKKLMDKGMDEDEAYDRAINKRRQRRYR